MTSENVCARLAALASQVLEMRSDLSAISVTSSYRSFDAQPRLVEDAKVYFHGARGSVNDIDDASLDGIAPVRRLEREASQLLYAVEHDRSNFETVDLRTDRNSTSLAVSADTDTSRIATWTDPSSVGCEDSARHEYSITAYLPGNTSGHELLLLHDIATVGDIRANATTDGALRRMEEDCISEAALEYIATLDPETPARVINLRDFSHGAPDGKIITLLISAADGDHLVRLL